MFFKILNHLKDDTTFISSPGPM